MVFCNKRGYKSDVLNLFEVVQNRSMYFDEVVPVDVHFKGKIRLDYEFYKVPSFHFKVNLDLNLHISPIF